jgi:hypothetical protein
MKQLTKGATAVAGAIGAVGAGGLVARRALAGRAGGSGTGADRWHAVTVYRPIDEVAPGGRLPEPLAALGDRIETRLQPAPGDRGTEVHARLVGSGPDGAEDPGGAESPVAQLRTALRTAKQLLETGEVLEPDRPGTTTPTPLNAPLRAAIRLGRGGGRL